MTAHINVRKTGILAISCIALTLAACSPNTPETPTPPAQNTAPQQIKTPSTPPRPAAAAATPSELGKKAYSRCRSCHTLEEGGRHRVGPNLWGIFGRTSGTAPQYAYSKAMKDKAIVWDAQTLDAYLTSPKKFIPGNKMAFIGLKKAEQRANLLAYLKEQTQK
jgi:cytochrome c